MTTHKHQLYLIGGLPQHGKSTVASFFGSISNMKTGNTSDIIYEVLSQTSGKDEETLRSQQKSDTRDALIATGDSLCSEDPAFLIKELARRGVQVITGLRKLPELEAIREFAKVVVIWVSRPNGTVIQDNTQLSMECADHVIINSGSLDTLYAKTAQLHADLNSGMRSIA